MAKVIAFIKKEIYSAIPAVIFFLIAFNLIVLTENLMLRQDHAGYMSYLTATIGAIAVGKFLLIVDFIPFVNAFPKKPLIYNIIWKFLMLGILALLFRIVEKSIEFTYDYENTSLIYSHLESRLSSPIFWAIQLWLLMLFAAYVVFTEIIHRMGKDKFNVLMFGTSKD